MGETANVKKVHTALVEAGIEGEVLSIILALVKLHGRPDRKQPAPASPASTTTGAIAREFLRSSLRRKNLIGRAADDPSWNMLLAIFADQEEGVKTTISSACHSSGSSETTSLRRLSQLEEEGLLIRADDPCDRRRIFLKLTSSASMRMAELIKSFCVPPPSALHVNGMQVPYPGM